MKNLKLLPLLLLMILSNCDNDNDPTNNVCDEEYITDTLINGFNPANYNILATMDLETQEYTIQINVDGEICSIGYQNSATYTGGYTMEVINITSGNNYSGIHTFSQTGLDYQPITIIPVTSGDIIKVKRTIQPGFTLFQDEIGNAIIKNSGSIPFPITFPLSNFSLLGSDAYGGGGPVTDFAIPIIGLGFKLN